MQTWIPACAGMTLVKLRPAPGTRCLEFGICRNNVDTLTERHQAVA